MASHQRKGSQSLSCEPPDQLGSEASEAVSLDELVEIDRKEFHSDAEMISEVERFGHLDDVELLVGIPLGQAFQNLDLDQSLMMESLLVPNQLDRD